MKPELSLRRGLVFDRCQGGGMPKDWENVIWREDMALVRSMGFDHAKVLLTPHVFMKRGRLDEDAMAFAELLISRAVDEGLVCLACIHPEAAFKQEYLASEERFEAMLGFYRDFAARLAARFRPDQMAFQLMTEPFANYTDWNLMHPRLHAAVRGVMPEHTLVLSGDQVGHLDGMLAMEPVADDNVYYGFTSYDPFAFTLQGWHAFFSGTSKGLDKLGALPYPASPELAKPRMAEILSDIAPEDMAEAQSFVERYAKGLDQKNRPVGPFNRAWHRRRMDEVSAWRKKWGRELPVLLNEFGVMDPVMSERHGGRGCRACERALFLRDLREEMEAHNIGWSYWSYNETFTCLDIQTREPYGHTAAPDPEILAALGVGAKEASK